MRTVVRMNLRLRLFSHSGNKTVEPIAKIKGMTEAQEAELVFLTRCTQSKVDTTLIFPNRNGYLN